MSEDHKMSRRDFLKASSAATASVVLPDYSKRPENVPPSVIIDGMETFGHASPLLPTEVTQLQNYINTTFDSGGYEYRDDTIYVWDAVWGNGTPSNYDEYHYIPATTNYENFQRFQRAHNQIIADIVAPLGLGYVARGLMVFDQSVFPPYKSNAFAFKGVDGSMHAGLFSQPYNPTMVNWDGYTNIDKTYAHEGGGHQGLRLPDTYAMEYDFNSTAGLTDTFLGMLAAESPARLLSLGIDAKALKDLKSKYSRELAPNQIPAPLQDVPIPWRHYKISERSVNDPRKEGMMNSLHNKLDSFTTWILKRRFDQGWLHDMNRTITEHGWEYPYEVPKTTRFDFGAQWMNSHVDVYRTYSSTGNDLVKELDRPPVFSGALGNSGEVVVGDLWHTAAKKPYGNRSVVLNTDSLLFVKVKDPNGNYGYRWLDIGDFSLGLGTKLPYPVMMEMKMNLGTNDILPTQLNTLIEYTDLTKRTYTPYITK